MKKFKFLYSLLFFIPTFLNANPYHFNAQQEVMYLGLGAGLSAAGWYTDSKKSDPTPQSVSQLNKDDIFKLDRFVAGRWNRAAATRSDVVLFTTAALPLVFPIVHKSSFWELSVLYLETNLIAYGGVTLAKGLTNRYRPYAYDSDAPDDELFKADTKRSFFSGHATLISSSSVFFAKVFSDMYPNSQHKRKIWTASGTLILYGGWQRMEAGMHFPSDVALGILWGSLVGYWVPEMHRKPNNFTLFPYIRGNNSGFSFSLFW